MSLENRWTGGQYSVYRVVFGLYLLVHFLQLLPWGAELFSNAGVLPNAVASPVFRLFPSILRIDDSPGVVTLLLAVAACASVFFAIGKWDRAAAAILWYIWACLFGRNPLINNPGLPYIGWLLLAHVFIPPSPYGAWSSRDRIDPSGAWEMPAPIYAVAWILMALGYTYSGYTKLVSPSWIDGTALARVLENPLARPGFLHDALLSLPLLLKIGTWGGLCLEIAFAPLALVRGARPWIWTGMLMMHLGLMILIDFVDLSFGMVVLHLFTFDPGWVRKYKESFTETIFYDGHCGLCHRFVRFVLAEDSGGNAFQFAPLQGERFLSNVPESQRKELPDSLVLATADKAILTKSTAMLHILRRLGGLWWAAALLVGLVPARLRDAVYDGMAGIRHRLFAAPQGACPFVPARLRGRFLT